VEAARHHSTLAHVAHFQRRHICRLKELEVVETVGGSLAACEWAVFGNTHLDVRTPQRHGQEVGHSPLV
jgi:hypothetical protein